MANILLGIHCAVPGCGSTLRKVNQWKVKACSNPRHKGKTHAQCMCPEPYQFFKFPTGIKLRKLWLERVKKPDLEINNLTRICSLHFIEGKPTRLNYFPTTNLSSEVPGLSEQDLEIDDDPEEDELVIEEAVAEQASSPRSGVSIVPVELLQEQEQEEDIQDEYNEGDLTISRYSYGREDDGLEMQDATYDGPTNTVTITRVSTGIKPPISRIGSGAIITTIPRATTAPSTNIKGPARTVGSASIVVRGAQPPKKAPYHRLVPVPGKSKPLQSMKPLANVASQDERYDQECPYEIDMIMDDDEVNEFSPNSSNASVDFQLRNKKCRSQQLDPPALTATSKPSAPGTLASQQGTTLTCKTVGSPVKSEPRILAVAPRTQQSSISHSVIARVDSSAAIPTLKKVMSATPLNPGFTTRNFLVSGSKSPAPICTPPVASLVSLTPVAPIKAAVSTGTGPSSSVTTMVSSTPQVPPKQALSPAPVATYDPSKQQLQIANPIKYIQECHTRIASLLAEKEKLEAQNSQLETKVHELQKSNNELRREIVHQTMSVTKRVTPTMHQENINMIPTITTADDQVPDEEMQGSVPPPKKSRIRYVIRRPANITKFNVSPSNSP